MILIASDDIFWREVNSFIFELLLFGSLRKYSSSIQSSGWAENYLCRCKHCRQWLWVAGCLPIIIYEERCSYLYSLCFISFSHTCQLDSVTIHWSDWWSSIEVNKTTVKAHYRLNFWNGWSRHSRVTHIDSWWTSQPLPISCCAWTIATVCR